MSDPKASGRGEDWTELLSHPEAVRNFDILLETYRKASPEKREQALYDALKRIRKRQQTPDDAAVPSIARGVEAPPFEPAGLAASPKERRRSPRTSCAVAVELWAEGASVPYWGTVINTSGGGCFVETTAPLRAGEKLEIGLWISSGTLWIKGVVLTGMVAQPKPRLGVRVKFSDMELAEREHLREFLRHVANATAGHDNEYGYVAQLKRNR